MPPRFVLFSALALWLLAGCAARPTPTPTQQSTSAPRAVSIPPSASEAPPRSSLAVQGALGDRSRVALPPDALAIVEVRESADAGGRIIAEQRIELEGRQVPIPFSISVPRAQLAAGRNYIVRGGIVADGRPIRVADAVPLEHSAFASMTTVDVGTLWIQPVGAAPYATAMPYDRVMFCGGRRIEVGFDGASLRLRSGGTSWSLEQAPSASGARYVAIDDPTTLFWNKGERAWLTIAGRDHPTCRLAPLEQTAFRALGNEPGWLLELGEDEATLVTDYGQARVTMPVIVADASADHTRHTGRAGGKRLTVTVHARACSDTMSGAHFPNVVEVLLNGTKLSGCGGNPVTVAPGS